MSQEELAELAQLRQEKEMFRKHRDETSAAAVLDRIRALPEDQALVLFRQLRATASDNNPASLLACAKTAQVVSTADCSKPVITTDDIPPPSPLSVEYELMIRHPVLYPAVSTKSIILPIGNVPAAEHEPHEPENLRSFLYVTEAPNVHRLFCIIVHARGG